MSGIQQMLLGGAPAVAANYIEDVFSTWLYTGNDSIQTINNGIDLAGKGGLVWIKRRDGAGSHAIYDTLRGTRKPIYGSNTTAAETVVPTSTPNLPICFAKSTIFLRSFCIKSKNFLIKALASTKIA